MTNKNIAKLTIAVFAVVTVTAVISSTVASAGWPGTKILDQTGCSMCCPACDHVCNLDAEQGEVERLCFDIEKKVICIPRVVFPWQKKKSCGSCDACDGVGCSACVHNGARTRTICVLKFDSYKCPKCKYTWSAEKKGCGSGCCDTGCCDTGACDSGCATAPHDSGAYYTQPQSDGLQPVAVEGSHQELPAPSNQ